MGLSDSGGGWDSLAAAFLHDEDEEQPMFRENLEVVVARIDYMEGRVQRRAVRGAVIEISDPDVARTLVNAKLCVRHGVKPVEQKEAEEGGAPAGDLSEKTAWDDVPGVSKASLEILRGSSLQPASVTDEELVEALGSATRAGYVRKAIEKMKASEPEG